MSFAIDSEKRNKKKEKKRRNKKFPYKKLGKYRCTSISEQNQLE